MAMANGAGLAPGEFQSLRILFIDDDAVTRAFVSKLCERLAVGSLRVASDADEALAIITRGGGPRFNLVISDWNMPGLSGLELLEQLRARGSTIPFVMVTARADKDSVLAAKRHAVSGYLRKPFRPKEFLAQLRSVLTRAAAIEDLP